MQRLYLLLVLLMALTSLASAEEWVGPFSSWTNVKTAFGAVGDGVTDDTAAFTNALAALKAGTVTTLYLPAGTYKITSTLHLIGRLDRFGIIGENPTNTILKWGGSAGTDWQTYSILWLDGVQNCQLARLTFDGNNTAACGVAQNWVPANGGGADDGIDYTEVIFKNAINGFTGGCAGYYCSQTHFTRCQFYNCTGSGAYFGNPNALMPWFWDCRFEDNYVGVHGGTGNFFVYNSVFKNSAYSDLTTSWPTFFSVRGNYSYNSNRFVHMGAAQVCPYILTDNRIIDPVQPNPVLLGYNGPLLVLDNQVRSRAGAIGPVFDFGGSQAQLVAVGNRFTIDRAVRTKPTARTRQIDQQVVAAGSINAAEPTYAGSVWPVSTRPVVEVTAFTGTAIQTAINTAIANYNGQRPIVHLPAGIYTATQTITVPANADVQLVGDPCWASRITTSTALDPVLQITGPTKVTLRNLSVERGATSLIVTNCDQPGSRLFSQHMYGENYAGSVGGFSFENLSYLKAHLQDSQIWSYVAPTSAYALQVKGPRNTAQTGLVAWWSGLYAGDQSGTHVKLVDDAQFMMFDNWNEQSPNRFEVKGTGTPGYFARVTIGNQHYCDDFTVPNPSVEWADFPGKILMTTLDHVGANPLFKISGTGANCTVGYLGVVPGENTSAFQNASTLGTQYVENCFAYADVHNRGSFVNIANSGNMSDTVLLDLLSQMRTNRHEPMPLADTAAGATDLRVYVCAFGDTSSVLGAKFIGSGSPSLPQVATPVFSPASAFFYPSVPVTITCATSGATIRYTTDGSEPTSTSAVYSTPLTLTSTTTLKAKAFLTSFADSQVGSGLFTLSSATVIPAGWARSGQHPMPESMVNFPNVQVEFDMSLSDNRDYFTGGYFSLYNPTGGFTPPGWNYLPSEVVNNVSVGMGHDDAYWSPLCFVLRAGGQVTR
ncbi:MAG: chitobiase/beta-hexosaminidase C-terminal domain-containing protein, partial [Armatimonadota bacterium]